MRQSSALKKTRVNSLGFMLIPLLMASCHARIHEIADPYERDKVPVTICVNNLSSVDYAPTRAMVDVGLVCSNLSICIYPCEGESFDKIQINQTRDDPSGIPRLWQRMVCR